MTRGARYQIRGLGANLRMPAFVLALAIVLAMAARAAQAQTYSVLHTFYRSSDSGFPYAGLTMDKAGNLYGTAYASFTCGVNECYGIVFKLSNKGAGWIFTPLYAFTGGADGSYPIGGVTIGPDGALYGTTTETFSGNGTVFRLAPPLSVCKSVSCPWIETVLYRFAGYDGKFPYGDLIFDDAGNLYGTTYGGGSYGNGTVFKLTHSGGSWTESVLHSFYGGTDGATPESGLVFDKAGNLYGTTYAGGYSGCSSNYGCGTVFQLTPAGDGWTESIIYYFQGKPDGDAPYAGLIFDGSGNLYGVASADGPKGGGTVFQLVPSNGGWTFNLLYALTGNSGSSTPNPGPRGSLVMDAAGNLYGVTIQDGGKNTGTAFELTPSNGGWAYSQLYLFCKNGAPCPDGAWPWAGMILDGKGNLFGTAIAGGYGDGNCSGGGCGVVFEITP
jgi:uncharacterized repeat protein (TIGR03803 family)